MAAPTPADPDQHDGMAPASPPGSGGVAPPLTVASRPPAARADRFTELVVPQIEPMLRVAHRLTGSWPDAEDVVQDALVRAYRALDGFDGRHPRAWLLTIVRHTHLSSLRRTRPLPADPSPGQGVALLEGARPAFGQAQQPSPEEVVADRLLDADVERALAGLDQRFRQAVLLVDVDRLTAAEAAQALGVPVGTVVSRLSRGRARLRSALAHRRTAPASDAGEDR